MMYSEVAELTVLVVFMLLYEMDQLDEDTVVEVKNNIPDAVSL